MKEIICPQINANDDSYIINELFYQNGDQIKNGDIIASIGSSKAVFDIEADASGLIFYKKNPSDEISVGNILAIIFESKEEYDSFLSSIKEEKISENHSDSAYILTKAAQKFADENNISEEQIKNLNKKIIKTEDLQKLISNNEDENTQKLSLNQIITASKVIQSHKEIPKAFQLIKTDCTKCEELIKSFSYEYGITIGYGEILTVIISELFDEFTNIFGKYLPDNRIKKAISPEIGITIDAGNGLFLPVIKSEKQVSLEEAANKLFEYKMKAIDNSFEEDDLSGGNISISYNPAKNLVCAAPIIFPNQSAMISVCSPIKELCFDNDKNVIERSYLYIGISFDHRVINGSYAMDFLSRISEKLENVDFIIKR